MKKKLPIVGFVGWSGSGKTTLLTNVLPILRAKNVRVGMVKHTHHNVEFDTPGKDSHRLRVAGANQMLVTSAKRWAMYGDKDSASETLDIHAEVARLNTNELDIILVESFKTAPIPKIELHRPSLEKPLLYPEDSHIVAIASDAAISVNDAPVQLDLNNPAQIAHYIMDTFL